MDQLFASIPEAAETFRVSTRTIKRMIKSGELDSILLGGRRLIPVAELERFYIDRVEEAREKAQTSRG